MEAVLTLAQLTDCHLQNNPSQLYRDIDVEQRLDRVLSELLSTEQSVDALLWTGDLVHHGRAQGYRRLRQRIAELALPSYWIPGNHDDAALMQQLGGALNRRALITEHWAVILLDSSSLPDGRGSGALAQPELDYLQQQLNQYREKNCLIVLHHNPVPVQSVWQDKIMLSNAAAFWDVVDEASQVKAVLCGHVHQQREIDYRAVKVLTTPSSSVQFKAGCEQFTIEDDPLLERPGYRLLQLYPDGQIKTSVKRVEC